MWETYGHEQLINLFYVRYLHEEIFPGSTEAQLVALEIVKCFVTSKVIPVACVAVSVMYLVDLIGYFSFNHARIKGKMTNNISCKFNWIHFHIRKVAQIKVFFLLIELLYPRDTRTLVTLSKEFLSYLFRIYWSGKIFYERYFCLYDGTWFRDGSQ